MRPSVTPFGEEERFSTILEEEYKKDGFPFGEENRNFLPLYDLMKNRCYKKFYSSPRYKPVPFLHLAYFFQFTRVTLGDPYKDGNILLKETLFGSHYTDPNAQIIEESY